MPSKRFTGFFDRRGIMIHDGSIVRIRHLLESQTAVGGGSVEYKVFWDGKKVEGPGGRPFRTAEGIRPARRPTWSSRSCAAVREGEAENGKD